MASRFLPSLLDRLDDERPGLELEMTMLRNELAADLAGDRSEALEWRRLLEAMLDDTSTAGLGRPGEDELEPFAGLPPTTRRRIADIIELRRRWWLVREGRYEQSMEQLRERVLDDLERLLNTESLGLTRFVDRVQPKAGATDAPGDVGIADFPQVARSVINYGIPPYAGKTMSSLAAESFAVAIRQAIERFEPRLMRPKVHVRRDEAAGDQDIAGGMAFEIEGMLWGVPAPIKIRLATFISLEDGRASRPERIG
jgi:type VI secretion system protein ImpF